MIFDVVFKSSFYEDDFSQLTLSKDNWLIEPSLGKQLGAVLADKLLLSVACGIIPPQASLPSVQTEQDARLLLLPLQTQSLLRVVWLSHYSAEIATLSHVQSDSSSPTPW